MATTTPKKVNVYITAILYDSYILNMHVEFLVN